MAIAKLSVSINELNDQMEKAANDKDFLKAAEIKAKTDGLNKEKRELEQVLEEGEPGKMAEAVQKHCKSAGNTPTAATSASSSAKKRPAAKVSTPGSATAGPSPTSANKVKKLTPKQEAKKAEQLKKREEREKEKLERQKKKDEEKQRKEEERRLKEEKKKETEALKEAEKIEKDRLRKEKEEKKEREKREKEEEKKAKEKAKEEEKRVKEEAKKAKVEAKLAKEEEKKKQEEAVKAKQEKTKAAFNSFFIKKSSEEKQEKEGEELSPAVASNTLNQFRVKKDMRVAPVLRASLQEAAARQLDKALEEEIEPPKSLYLDDLRNKGYFPGKAGKTWPYQDAKKDDDDDIEIIEDEEDDLLEREGNTTGVVISGDVADEAKPTRAKLLQFSENQRPPYWGTWTKKSKHIGPRKPFGQDNDLFDYDYDSDDDWEEEEQGESLSDEEKDKEEEEDDAEDEEDDDGFFVGHGVLDKDEILNDEDEDGDDAYDEDLEMKKQKLRAQQFEEEYKKRKPAKLKPSVIGCLWEVVGESCILDVFRAVLLSNTPVQTLHSTPASSPKEPGSTPSSKKSSASTTQSGEDGEAATPASARAKKVFPDEAMPDLIRLVHANRNSKMFLAKEFLAYWGKKKNSNSETAQDNIEGTPKSSSGGSLSRNFVNDRVVEIADYIRYTEPGPMLNRKCWVVKKEVLDKFNVASDSLEVPNNWKYILEEPKKADLKPAVPDKVESAAATPPEKKPEVKESPSIKSFFSNIAVKRKPKQSDSEN